MANSNFQDPFSLLPEDEKDFLNQNFVDLEVEAGGELNQAKEDESTFLDNLVVGAANNFAQPGPISLRQSVDVASYLAPAIKTSFKNAMPLWKQSFLSHQDKVARQKILTETGQIATDNTGTLIGFGEGAASRMGMQRVVDLKESARKEQEELFNQLPIQEKKEIVNNYKSFVAENSESYNLLADQIDKNYKDADLTENQRAVSAGIDSLLMMSPGILATLGTKNPSYMMAMVPMFGYYEQGSSYRQAIMSGLSHKEALKVSNINALSEMGTELMPLPFVGKVLNRYWKDNGSSINNFVKNGFKTTALEMGGEQLNLVIQETNLAINGVNTDLKFAWANKDNPNYEGPSWIDVMLDKSKMTAIATAVGAGGMVSMQGAAAYGPDVALVLNELDPNLGRRIGRELDILTKQVNTDYKSIDDTFTFVANANKFDPGSRSVISSESESQTPLDEMSAEDFIVGNRQYYNFVMPEILADEYLADRFIKNDPFTENLTKEELSLIDAIQSEVSDLSGIDLKNSLELGRKSMNILNQATIIDPEKFDDQVKERIAEYDVQIGSTKNEDKIKKLKADQTTLSDFLKSKQKFEQPQEPVARKKYGNNDAEDSFPDNQDLRTQEILGRDRLLIDDKILETSDPVQIENVKKEIILPKAFSPKNLITYRDIGSNELYEDRDVGDKNGIPYGRSWSISNANVVHFRNTRDLNDIEVDVVSEVVNNQLNMGMPKEILDGVPYIGIHSSINDFGDSVDAYGQYFPTSKHITLSSGLFIDNNVNDQNIFEFSSFNQENLRLGSLTDVQISLAHELGHYVDFGFVEYQDPMKVIEPLSATSPLFNPIDFYQEFDNILKKSNKTSISELTLDEIQDYNFTTGGPVMQEMFKLYVRSRSSENPLSGELLSYPFDRFIIDAHKKKFPMLDDSVALNEESRSFTQSETFAQLFGINYANPKLLKDYPNSLELLQRINNAVSTNRVSQIGRGLRDAFQSSRSDGDSKVYNKRATYEDYKREFGEESAREDVGEPPLARDRDSVRPSVQEVNYVPIGELKLKKNNTYDGAPRTAPGVFNNTQKDYDDLANYLVTLAEEKEVSLLDESRHWYKNTNDEIDALVGGNLKIKEDVLRMLTIYSSQTPVETNLAYTLRSLVAMAKGGDPLPGFQPEAGVYVKEALAAPDFGQKLNGVGFKLQSFYENLTGKNPDAVTMDTWMFRMLGFEKGQGALANHRYGTSVIQEATKVYNNKYNDSMTPMEMQAVLWTWARNKQLIDQGKTPEYVGYETFMDKASAIVTGEVVPTESLPQFAFAEKLNQKQKSRMTKEMLDVITTSEGRNSILDLMPGTGLYKFSHSFGAYDGKTNPNILTNLLLEKVQGERQFNALDLEYADDFLRAWGYVFRQEAMPYFVSNENISDTDAYDVNNEAVNVGSYIKFVDSKSKAPFEITSILRKQLRQALEKQGVDGFTQMAQDSISVVNFKFDGNVVESFNEKVESALDSVGLEGVGFAVEHDIKYNTQYLSNNWQENPNGEGYLQGRLEKGSIQQGLDRIRTKVDGVLDKYRHEVQENGPDAVFPTTGSEPGAVKRRPDDAPVAKSKSLPKEQEDLIDEAFASIAPPPPPAPPKGPDPDGKFSPREVKGWADQMEGFNIAVANKFGRLWTIEEDITKQFGSNGIVNRLLELGLDPDSKDWRVTTQTDIFPGRTKDRLRDLREQKYEPLLKFLTQNNISEEEYNHFIYNLHAPERNAYLPTLFEEKLSDAQEELRLLEQNPDTPKQELINAKRKATVIQKKFDKAESGSGIKTDEAILILKKYGVIYDLAKQKARGSLTKGKNLLKAYEQYHKPIIEGTRQTYVDAGLIPEQVVTDWSSRYKYYVPLVGFAEDTLIDPKTGREITRPQSKNSKINSQMTISGPTVTAATGRESIADSPLQQTIIQATGAIIEAEKNRVTKSLADLARAFPSDLWEVSEDVGQMQKVDAKWDPTKAKSRVGFKEDGVQKYVEIYDKRLAAGFDNFDSEVNHWFMKTLRSTTRYLSMVNTSLDPAFMINNFLRDVQTGYFNLLAEEEIVGGRAKNMEIAKKYYTTKNILTNAVNLIRFEKNKSLNAGAIEREFDVLLGEGVDLTPEVINSVQKKYELTPEQVGKEIGMRKFKVYGGETGYIEQKSIAQLTKEFTDLRDMYAGNFKGTAKSGMKSIFSTIERMNVGIENAARFTAFEGFIQTMGGYEKATPADYERAASLSKNLTINFNRMGTMGPTANALYMFFNASIQGSVNVFRGLTPGNVSSRKVKSIGALSAIGSTTTLWNILMSGEDDDGRLYYEKIPEWEKQTKYIMMFPNVEFADGELEIEKWGSGSKYNIVTKDGRKYPLGLGIPMPYGYAIFANTGRVSTEIALGKTLDNYDKSFASASLDLAESFLHNYSPISMNIDKDRKLLTAGMAAIPSAFKPAANLIANRDHFGSPIYYEPMFGERTPSAERETKKTLDFIEGMTKEVNRVTGGNEFFKGSSDIDPSIIQYILDEATGGVGRTTRRTFNFAFSPDRPTLNQIAGVRRITVTVTDAEDRAFFRENINKVKDIEDAYKKLSLVDNPSEDPDDFLKRVGEDVGELGNLMNEFQVRSAGGNFSLLKQVEDDLKYIREEKMQIKNTYRETNVERYAYLMDKINLEEINIMKAFNKEYLEAVERSEKKIERNKRRKKKRD